MISEVNVIGTAYLRTQLVPDEYREPARKLISDYVRRRSTASRLDLTVLIVLVIFIIIDLDRPRRRLIEVNQESMLDLGTAMAPATVK